VPVVLSDKQNISTKRSVYQNMHFILRPYFAPNRPKYVPQTDNSLPTVWEPLVCLQQVIRKVSQWGRYQSVCSLKSVYWQTLAYLAGMQLSPALLNAAADATLLRRILEIPGLYLARKRAMGPLFPSLSSVPPEKYQDSTLNKATVNYFHSIFNYPLIILSFDALQSELLTASLNKPPNKCLLCVYCRRFPFWFSLFKS
jgi:uncharacterized membrane protein YfbV (UPF0208 family)